ncbi:rhodanese-like domain-containing protein [Halomonas cerina]|uniref:Rhodanese-related sulfurtransferase n=1 Tax=Halomonas cerina TaxID=447424 RepID=A0A839VAW3_9GAMM|nr:rhodanese-like domain-containing protein [Halomonas cerina]MBB3189847.1 rhodanese-related sulfurtransferase [Halomonas cerina]
MTTIDTATLHDWQRRHRDFTLVDTLPAEAFAKGHLPGAINIVSDDIMDAAPAGFPRGRRPSSCIVPARTASGPAVPPNA